MSTVERYAVVRVPFPFTDPLAGLSQPCLVRFKLFTLDERLILGILGGLGATDRAGVAAQLNRLLPARE